MDKTEPPNKTFENIHSGDKVRVYQIIQEKDKQRTQVFEGIVLAKKHGQESGATITVRKVVSGVGVERIFPLFSPNIKKIEVIEKKKTKKAKLYYLKGKREKVIRKKLKQL